MRGMENPQSLTNAITTKRIQQPIITIKATNQRRKLDLDIHTYNSPRKTVHHQIGDSTSPSQQTQLLTQLQKPTYSTSFLYGKSEIKQLKSNIGRVNES